jgi:4-carboxymuconolactone decarboxylase
MPSRATADLSSATISHHELLRRLGAADHDAARAVLALRLEPSERGGEPALAPRVTTLVRLASLVAVDAPATSLRWAVELAACAGASDDEIVAVLVTVAADIGVARVVSAAPRLAMAIGYDVEGKPWGLD